VNEESLDARRERARGSARDLASVPAVLRRRAEARGRRARGGSRAG
jgi:hypothetical protein